MFLAREIKLSSLKMVVEENLKPTSKSFDKFRHKVQEIMENDQIIFEKTGTLF